jgi:hypothetical protein
MEALHTGIGDSWEPSVHQRGSSFFLKPLGD